MRCANCNRPIQRPYYYNGDTYGIECWKSICLPQILARRESEHAQVEHERYLSAWCDIEVLKLKDMSKITSTFKREFIPSVIAQFKERGFVSDKQSQILTDMFNQKDWQNCFRLRVEAGLADRQNLIDCGLMKSEDF